MTASKPASLMTDEVVYFSYSQVMVFDSVTTSFALAWTSEHSNQGFARRESIVSFGTLLEFGHARLNVFLGAYQPSNAHRRVIAVPFHAKSGNIHIEGPEDEPRSRWVYVTAGYYRVTAGQMILDERRGETKLEQGIDLFFERLEEPAPRSEILVADEELNPPAVLIEHVDTLDT